MSKRIDEVAQTHTTLDTMKKVNEKNKITAKNEMKTGKSFCMLFNQK